MTSKWSKSEEKSKEALKSDYLINRKNIRAWGCKEVE